MLVLFLTSNRKVVSIRGLMNMSIVGLIGY